MSRFVVKTIAEGPGVELTCDALVTQDDGTLAAFKWHEDPDGEDATLVAEFNTGAWRYWRLCAE